MKHFIIAFLLFIPTQLFAQENEEVYKTTSLNFEINTLSLRSFYGGIGGKTWLSDSFTLVASIGAQFSKDVAEQTTELTEGESESIVIRFRTGIEKHFDMSNNISLYLPAGVSVGYGNSQYTSRIEKDTIMSVPEAQFNDYHFSADVGMGIEFWLSKRISLSGQHLFSFTYSSSKSTYKNYEDRENRSYHTFSFRTGTSAIILAIYF